METYMRVTELLVYIAVCIFLLLNHLRMRCIDHKLNLLLGYKYDKKPRRMKSYVSSRRRHGPDNETARETICKDS